MSDTPFARSPSNRVAVVFFAMGALAGGGTVTVLHDANAQMAAADASYKTEVPTSAPVVPLVVVPLKQADAAYSPEGM